MTKTIQVDETWYEINRFSKDPIKKIHVVSRDRKFVNTDDGRRIGINALKGGAWKTFESAATRLREYYQDVMAVHDHAYWKAQEQEERIKLMEPF